MKGQNPKDSVYDKPHPFEEKGGPKLNRTEVFLLIQLTALNALLIASSELRIQDLCEKVEVNVLGSPSLIIPVVSVDVKQR